MKKIIKIFIFFVFNFLTVSLFGGTVTLSADSDMVRVDEAFRLILTAEGDFDSIVEPDFNGFEIENRSESQSNSISIVNGRMKSSKSISYTYSLRPSNSGVFKVGPAKLTSKNGKTDVSNTITITVTGSSSGGGSQGSSQNNLLGNDQNDQSDTGSPVPGSLVSPLTNWEKKTPNYFLRIVVEPQGDIYEGEPVTVRYYLFVKPGSISDLSMYKSPSFENCWKEEKQESNLSFKRVAIGGDVYDYALVKTFVLVPEKGLKNLTGTQMILDVMTGSFFNVKKRSISSPALMLPLNPLPDGQNYPDGVFGDFKVETDKSHLTIDKSNMLETVEYKISGCGSFQSVEMKPEENRGLKIFSPEVDNKIGAFSRGYCGEKKYKFMLKGLNKGTTVLKMKPFEAFSREKGWVKVTPPEVTVDVNDVTASSDNDIKDKKLQNFELLKELPAGMKIYSTESIVQRIWFKVMMVIPFLISFISFLVWLVGIITKRRSKSFNAKIDKWQKAILEAKDPTELLNIFYDALKDLYSIEIRGERSQNLIKKHGNSFADVTELIREIEYMTFSGSDIGNITPLKEKASKTLMFRGKRK